MSGFKKCFKCQQEKKYSDFYKHSAMGDGYLGKCKECTKNDVAAHRLLNIEKIRKYDRDRYQRPERKAKQKKIADRWANLYPKRILAQGRLHKAVLAGNVKRLPCIECGGKAEAHHPDYDRPLEVVWLCTIHHRQLHAQHLKRIRDEHKHHES